MTDFFRFVEEEIECAKCGSTFKNFLQLKPHVRKVHPDVEQFILRESLAEARDKGEILHG